MTVKWMIAFRLRERQTLVLERRLTKDCKIQQVAGSFAYFFISQGVAKRVVRIKSQLVQALESSSGH